MVMLMFDLSSTARPRAFVPCGIDPGLSGAIAIQNSDGAFVHVSRLPVVQLSPKKKLIDAHEVARLLREHGVTHVAIEDVASRPGQGIASTSNFMKAVGTCFGVAAGIGSIVRWVTPARWQKPYGLYATGRSYAERKEASRQKAIALFPELQEHLKFKNRSDLAEAALISEHGRTRMFGPLRIDQGFGASKGRRLVDPRE